MRKLLVTILISSALCVSFSNASPAELAAFKERVNVEYREIERLMPQRKQRVEDGFAFCVSNFCDFGTEAYENNQTSALDQILLGHILRARKNVGYLEMVGHLDSQEQSEFRKFYYAKEGQFLVQVGDKKISARYFAQSLFRPTSDPRDSIATRWGIPNQEFFPLPVNPTENGLSLNVFQFDATEAFPDSILNLPTPDFTKTLRAVQLGGNSNGDHPVWGSNIYNHFGALIQFYLKIEESGIHELQFQTQHLFRFSLNGQFLGEKRQGRGMGQFETVLNLPAGYYRVDLERYHRNIPPSRALDYFNFGTRKNYENEFKYLEYKNTFLPLN